MKLTNFYFLKSAKSVVKHEKVIILSDMIDFDKIFSFIYLFQKATEEFQEHRKNKNFANGKIGTPKVIPRAIDKRRKSLIAIKRRLREI